MTLAVFETWFESFITITATIRPLVLIFDGHMSHTSLGVAEKAHAAEITLIKLPAHCTDLLQPLDVSCFFPLKKAYDNMLTEIVSQTGAKEPLRKGKFVDLPAKVWHKGLSPENIRSGFKKTGIFPVDPDKYDNERISKSKMELFQAWRETGSRCEE